MILIMRTLLAAIYTLPMEALRKSPLEIFLHEKAETNALLETLCTS